MPKSTQDFISKKKADTMAKRMKRLGYKVTRRTRRRYGEKVYSVTWHWKRKR